ncbi:AAA family ATPase [Flavobacterium magnum]|uniref:AAA family ATPase n=1 Tax=Flavobacterium magnum TaxID=2162713 RepID=A0A2S0RIV1_9FLAO|nr:ATP-binding protein [Flavobacterium magnum]AWA31061.1 AAA family ATPase [Flavobacterium magnum]
MVISRIKLANWKNFQNVDIELKNRVFMVGANASGKSNFLDAIRFVRDIVKQAGGLQYAVDQRGGVSKIRSLTARRRSDVALELYLSPNDSNEVTWIYYLSFKSFGGGIIAKQATILEERVTNNNGKVIVNRNSKDKNEDSETLKFTWLEQPNSNKDFRDINFFFREVQYLHIVPQLIRDPESYLIASNKEDFYGRNLLDKIDRTNKQTQNSYLKRINDVLKLAVPQLSNIKFVKDEKGIPHLEAIYEHWRSKGAKQQESQFSDGTLRLIGFMWALLDGQETILLEEPELYLHSAIVKQLPEFIYNLQRRKGRVRQVIISTHSYDILSSEGIGQEETLVLLTTPEGTEIKKAMDIEDVKRYLDAGFSMAESVIPKVSPQNIQGILELNE